MDLTEDQWSVVSSILPELPKHRDGRGRPWRCSRAVLDGILWILRTGAPWHDLPGQYPPYQTCHRRFQRWVVDGTLEHILNMLAEDLYHRGGFHRRYVRSYPKRRQHMDKTKWGRGSKLMAMADRSDFPVAIHIQSTSPKR